MLAIHPVGVGMSKLLLAVPLLPTLHREALQGTVVAGTEAGDGSGSKLTFLWMTFTRDLSVFF